MNYCRPSRRDTAIAKQINACYLQHTNPEDPLKYPKRDAKGKKRATDVMCDAAVSSGTAERCSARASQPSQPQQCHGESQPLDGGDG